MRSFPLRLGLPTMVGGILLSTFPAPLGAAVGILGDFNDGTLDGWSNVDLLSSSDVVGWDVNTAIIDGTNPRGNFTTGDAGAAHVDSDVVGPTGGEYNIALESPEFDIGVDEVLVFTHQFRSDTNVENDSANVEISTDGGIMWTLLTNYTDTQGTLPAFPYTEYVANGVQEFVNLNPYSGATNAKVRFRYQGNGWDWWWQVDNIAVIPEPSAATLICLGCLIGFRRNRKLLLSA